ncbi:MAG: hypothetical protein K6B75_04670 [Lachnospiraceae bacterium]|nr:hypothetical protein [Lachnospiraceae bacterium]
MNRIRLISGLAITVLLLFLGLASLLAPQKDYSENENRNLASFPKISLSGLADGSFMKGLECAITDHFPLREKLVLTRNRIKMALGHKDIGGAYIGKNGYLFEKVTEKDINTDLYKKNLKRIHSLSEEYKNIRFNVMLVPSSGAILKEMLPSHAQVYNAEALLSLAEEELKDCRVIHLTSPLEQAAESMQVFYKTDHHWTENGAYVGYWILTNGEGAYKTLKTLPGSDELLGTLYSKVLTNPDTKDTINLPVVEKDVKVKINGKDASLYCKEKLEEKDKYAVFLGGNHGLAEIFGTGKGNILILKDSFANGFVPFLTKDYAKITMIDLRFYSGSVKTYMAENSFDDVLVLYELNNFANDTNIAKLGL